MAALVYCRVCREQFETVLKLKSPTAIFHYDLQVIAAVKKKKNTVHFGKRLKTQGMKKTQNMVTQFSDPWNN